MTGALSRGSFYSVVAGTKHQFRPTYYSSSYELLQLHKAHRDVINHFIVRDKVFDNKFPGCSIANGLFKMVPNKRENYHMRELTESIRKRSIWMSRIANQRRANNSILLRASKALPDCELEKRFSCKTADADAYFNPRQHKGSNTWPNYWQHPSQKHVIPTPRWKRVPQMDNITRVQDPITCPSMDY